ncbi:MAG: hypothetical protein AAB437_03545 [Patescibacteria group bacterium]
MGVELFRKFPKYLNLLNQYAEHFKQETLVKSVGNKLFLEGLDYNHLVQQPKMFMAPEGSHHLNYVLHDEQIPPFISIHFRSGLKELTKGSLMNAGRMLLINLEKDFEKLVKEFEDNPKLKDVSLIIGLTDLSEKWGRNHGFSTIAYSHDTTLLNLHNESLGIPSRQPKTQLTLFWMTKEKAAEVFTKPLEEKS